MDDKSATIIEEFAEQIHNWYLEACRELDPSNFNAKAQVPYADLTAEQKFLDRFLARKLLTPIDASTVEEKCICGIAGPHSIAEHHQANLAKNPTPPAPSEDWEKEFEKSAKETDWGGGLVWMGSGTLKAFIAQTIEKAYQDGLNLRREYNDPALLKKFETSAIEAYRSKLIERIKTDFSDWQPSLVNRILDVFKEAA